MNRGAALRLSSIALAAGVRISGGRVTAHASLDATAADPGATALTTRLDHPSNPFRLADRIRS